MVSVGDDSPGKTQPDGFPGKTLYPAGETIDDRYEIERRVGHGATSDVYKAKDLRTGSVVALKIMNHTRLRDPMAQRRFHREASVQSMVDHPNVAAILGNGITAGNEPYLVLELFSGRCLRSILNEETRVDLSRACAYTLQILRGLAACHALGIRHRDLKPENMMMRSTDGSEEEVVLIDFGFASLEGHERLTAHGFVVGSMSYMAPERLLGERGDARADIYAVGVTLFELLTGKKPFVGEDKELAFQHLEADPPSPCEVAPDADIPEAIASIVLAALAKEPAARFQSAEAMAQALYSASGAAEAAASSAISVPEAVLLYCDTDGVERSHPLGEDAIVIGRGPECTIRSEDPLVSRHHARIYPGQDGHYWIEDLDSTNGVWVGTERTKRAAIPYDELALVGSLVLRIQPTSQEGKEGDLRAGIHTRLWMWLKAERAARAAVEQERNALGHRLGEFYQAVEHLAKDDGGVTDAAAKKLAVEFSLLRANLKELREMMAATEEEKVELASTNQNMKRQLSLSIQKRTVELFAVETTKKRLAEELSESAIQLQDLQGELQVRDGQLSALRQDLEALSQEAVVGGQAETLALVAAQVEKGKLAERVIELGDTVDELRRDVEDRDNELDQVLDTASGAAGAEQREKQVAELTAELEQVRFAQHQGHATVARLRIQLDAALADVGELRSWGTNVTAYNAENLSRLELEKAKLGEQVAALDGELGSLRVGAKEADAELVRLGEELLGARAEVEAAWAEVEHLREKSGGN